MFQSTQCLRFRALVSLGLGHFNIHPPLPMTPRESTQLLNLLTTSFRRQLDREHGTPAPEADVNNKIPGSASTSNIVLGRHRRHSKSRSDTTAPTDRHLQSILTNPLFRDVEKRSVTGTETLRDPMEIFDEACAKGFMKLEHAAACLKVKKRKILRSSALSVRDAMKSSGAGSKALDWMLSSGAATDGSFLEDKVFSEILIDFLVAEGRQSIIWTWLETLALKISSADTKPAMISLVNDSADMLYYLVKAQASGSTSLDEAFRSLGRAQDMLSGVRHKVRPVLKVAGEYLYTQILRPKSSQLASSPDVFDNFLSIVPKFLPLANETALPNLFLYHPTEPKVEPAMEHLRKARKIASSTSDSEAQLALLCAKPYNARRIINLGLRTARILLERGLHSEAQWVMNFLEESFGDHLGLSQSDLHSLRNQVDAEALNIELLNNLKMA